MAKEVVKAGYLALGAGPTDYSAQVASAMLTIEVETGDTTNYASGGDKEFEPGLRGYSLEIEWKKDADLSGLDLAIWTAITGTGKLAFEVKKSSGATSASNPKYSGTVVITGWSPGPGALGQVFGGNNTWTVTGAVTRATA